MDLTFEHRADQSRFVALDGHGRQLGEVDYHLLADPRGTVAVVTHTGTDPSARGQGIAGRLTGEVFDVAAQLGWLIRPQCPYTRTWLERHPERAGQVSTD